MNSIYGFIIIIIICIILLIITLIMYTQVTTVSDIHEAILNNKITNIPNVIHRTWYSKTMNNYMYDRAYLTWVKLNPNYTMKWYIDEDCEEFMKNFGEQEYLTYKKIIPTAYKADLWRACKLYKEGGVYVDSYSVNFVAIDDIIKMTGLENDKDIFISILDSATFGSGIHNGLIIATPQHPILKQYINDIVKNVAIGKEDVVMSLTGPLCLSKSIKILNKSNKSHEAGLNDGIYKYYLFQHNFGIYQSISDKKTILLNKKYDFLYCLLYQKVLNFSSSNYWYMNCIGKTIR